MYLCVCDLFSVCLQLKALFVKTFSTLVLLMWGLWGKGSNEGMKQDMYQGMNQWRKQGMKQWRKQGKKQWRKQGMKQWIEAEKGAGEEAGDEA